MASEHYDVVIIGSGPGGATMAWRLAQTGKRILVVERGDYLPRGPQNWSSQAVIVDGVYQAKETWYGADGRTFHPGLHYFVGGNSKFYGSVLFRLRERDFAEIRHPDGLSPAWPVGYDEFEPFYQAAEELFHVHGLRGEDPIEPPATGPYPHPPIAHEPRIQTLFDDLKRQGRRPFHLPVGIRLEEEDGRPLPTSPCVKCEAFDGFPCPTNGKADAQVMCIDPALRDCPNLSLSTNTLIERIETDARGGAVTRVVGTRDGAPFAASADVYVVACGALSSALLLLRSASDAHPAGLGNGSGQVGRNYMRHNNSVLLAVSRTPNPTRFQKTLGLNDFYFGDPDAADGWDFPLGHIQMVGKSDGAQLHGEGLPHLLQWFPEKPFDWIARHSVDFWLTSEDIPKPENRVFYRDGNVRLDLTETNMESHRRLRGKLQSLLDGCNVHPHLIDRTLYLGQNIPIGGTAHQAGTVRFGEDPATSVLDRDCKAHELDNLYVTDGGFFPSIGAVNPTLTIIANALRVAERIIARLGATDVIAPPRVHDHTLPREALHA